MKDNIPYPIFEKISIEINSYCNRSCSFCTRTLDNREKVRMPEELVHKVLYELAAIKYNGRIAFHFFNEVFTDNRIFSFFEKCKELGLNNPQIFLKVLSSIFDLNSLIHLNYPSNS